tara:strand:+ start:681 stop:956 length:276 start_codon:yes stop_codon:yes gene_type:complete
MAKKIENMTLDERIAHFEKEREKEKKQRQMTVNLLSPLQQAALYNINSKLDNIVDTALYPDLGGIRSVSAFDLQELNDAWETLQFQFNLKD